jgi:hypothetical protein
MSVSYVHAHAVYKRAALKTLSSSAPSSYYAVACALHTERLALDILYALFCSSAEDSALLLRVLLACFELTTKKYAPNLAGSRMIREARAHLLSPAAGVDIRLFQLMFFLQHEEELQHMILATYVTPESKDAARAFLTTALKDIIEPTLNWPWSRLNIAGGVDAMVHAARKAYLTTSSPRMLK